MRLDYCMYYCRRAPKLKCAEAWHTAIPRSPPTANPFARLKRLSSLEVLPRYAHTHNTLKDTQRWRGGGGMGVGRHVMVNGWECDSCMLAQ
jgi:hypothetical protein